MLQGAHSVEARPTLAALRLARTGGHVFESIGRYRVDAAREAERSRLVQLRAVRLQRFAVELWCVLVLVFCF